MITVTWQQILLGFLAVCAGFSSICVAGGWLIKIVKALKKPSDDTKSKFSDHEKMFANDNKRINNLEAQFAFVLKAISLLLQDDLVILNHLRTDNNTGEIAKQEAKVQEFLIKR